MFFTKVIVRNNTSLFNVIIEGTTYYMTYQFFFEKCNGIKYYINIADAISNLNLIKMIVYILYV